MAVDAGPSRKGFAVTPNDSTAIPVGRALLVGVAGNITGRQAEDDADIVYPVQAGVNPMAFKLIKSTGTTASGLVVLF